MSTHDHTARHHVTRHHATWDHGPALRSLGDPPLEDPGDSGCVVVSPEQGVTGRCR